MSNIFQDGEQALNQAVEEAQISGELAPPEETVIFAIRVASRLMLAKSDLIKLNSQSKQ